MVLLFKPFLIQGIINISNSQNLKTQFQTYFVSGLAQTIHVIIQITPLYSESKLKFHYTFVYDYPTLGEEMDDIMSIESDANGFTYLSILPKKL